MDQYFARMKSFANKEELPSRIRFMLQDVEELRKNGVSHYWFCLFYTKCMWYASLIINSKLFIMVKCQFRLYRILFDVWPLSLSLWLIMLLTPQLYNFSESLQWKPRHINRDTGPRTITEIRKEAADVSIWRVKRLLFDFICHVY